jgi:hypothetical protein
MIMSASDIALKAAAAHGVEQFAELARRFLGGPGEDRAA